MLEKIIKISKEAGEIIYNGFGKKLTLEYKSTDSDFVTNIDKSAEKMIIDFISKEYPTNKCIKQCWMLFRIYLGS